MVDESKCLSEELDLYSEADLYLLIVEITQFAFIYFFFQIDTRTLFWLIYYCALSDHNRIQEVGEFAHLYNKNSVSRNGISRRSELGSTMCG